MLLEETLIKIGAKILFDDILQMISGLRPLVRLKAQ